MSLKIKDSTGRTMYELKDDESEPKIKSGFDKYFEERMKDPKFEKKYEELKKEVEEEMKEKNKDG